MYIISCFYCGTYSDGEENCLIPKGWGELKVKLSGPFNEKIMHFCPYCLQELLGIDGEEYD